MKLSPQGKMFLGSVIIVFGIAVLADFSLLKAAIYVSGVFLSILLFV